MVETTPLGKWSGRRRTNLRLVLSSPRDKVNMKASVSLREGGAMLEVKVEKCAGIDVGKKFLAVCILIGLANQKPVGEVRRFGTSVKELERLRTWLLESGCTEAVMERTGSYWKTNRALPKSPNLDTGAWHQRFRRSSKRWRDIE